jgi:hypothetical protein
MDRENQGSQGEVFLPRQFNGAIKGNYYGTVNEFSSVGQGIITGFLINRQVFIWVPICRASLPLLNFQTSLLWTG